MIAENNPQQNLNYTKKPEFQIPLRRNSLCDFIEGDLLMEYSTIDEPINSDVKEQKEESVSPFNWLVLLFILLLYIVFALI